ncbi:MAG: glycosyltransferase family 2 protein [Erysipelotrichaceae bacterium]|nr:glycosyltransferase family 2 protein [Erysipelotrichaceae bacterium]
MPQDYECIVVDDGSDDGTKKCLQSLDSHQENVRIIYADHQGAGFAGNTEGSAFSRRRMEIKKTGSIRFILHSMPVPGQWPIDRYMRFVSNRMDFLSVYR